MKNELIRRGTKHKICCVSCDKTLQIKPIIQFVKVIVKKKVNINIKVLLVY